MAHHLKIGLVFEVDRQYGNMANARAAAAAYMRRSGSTVIILEEDGGEIRPVEVVQAG